MEEVAKLVYAPELFYFPRIAQKVPIITGRIRWLLAVLVRIQPSSTFLYYGGEKMPNRDKTGPDGQGPLTGRGLGPCGDGTPRGGGRGRGQRRGSGRRGRNR